MRRFLFFQVCVFMMFCVSACFNQTKREETKVPETVSEPPKVTNESVKTEEGNKVEEIKEVKEAVDAVEEKAPSNVESDMLAQDDVEEEVPSTVQPAGPSRAVRELTKFWKDKLAVSDQLEKLKPGDIPGMRKVNKEQRRLRDWYKSFTTNLYAYELDEDFTDEDENYIFNEIFTPSKMQKQLDQVNRAGKLHNDPSIDMETFRKNTLASFRMIYNVVGTFSDFLDSFSREQRLEEYDGRD